MITERVDIQNVLSQMRALKSQAQQGAGELSGFAPAAAPGEVGQVKAGGFGELLKRAVDGVNETQQSAKKMSTAYERGDPSVDLPQVMIGLQKASISFEAMTQVRNRLVAAYEDISKMPI
ncbi:MAG: flagellar hook-basal body complex protein FliE [Motiliproteus sp.]|jgi:flagellar hook-basal body complex protein FliE